MPLPVWSSMFAGLDPVEVIVAVRIEGRPIVKARPRRGKGGRFYTPRSTREGEAMLAAHLREAMTGPIATGQVGMRCYFAYQGVRFDIDNALKALLDAGNGVAWADDDQIVRIIAEKERAGPEHTQVVVYALDVE